MGEYSLGRFLKPTGLSKCIRDLIRPSLEWLSRHRWANPTAHPHLFPAQGLHLPTKHITADEKEK